MSHPRKIATSLLAGGAAIIAAGGILLGQSRLARRAIGTTNDRPPSANGVYGDGSDGTTVRLLILGDSAAVGYGMDRAEATPPAMVGIGLSHVLGVPVDVASAAVVGATSHDLDQQIDRGLEHHPSLALIIIGANDVIHQIPPRSAARVLGAAVRRLVAEGCDVIVGTCPDLGSVQPIRQPLRSYVRLWSRRLARFQTISVANAGGRAVSLGDLLGPTFDAHSDLMFGVDRFHPSETGYANMISVLIPSLAAAVHEREIEQLYLREPRDLIPLNQAASHAIHNPGTEVSREGRWATVLHRRRHPRKHSR